MKKYISLSLVAFVCLLDGLFTFPAAANPPPGHHVNCRYNYYCHCALQLNNFIEGRQTDFSRVNRGAGVPAEQVFLNGGSENIPVMCRTVLYLNDHDPAWFNAYFDVQKRPDIRFSGNELFSPAYTHQILGSVLIVLGHSIERGDAALEARASEWLKAYWSYLTLASTYTSPQFTRTSNLPGGFVRKKTEEFGFGITIPGTRAYVQKRSGPGLQDVFMGIALNHPGRQLKSNLKGAYFLSSTLRAWLIQQQFPINSRGKVILTSRELDPRFVGLTSIERNQLNDYILSNGASQTRSVLEMLGDFGFLTCNLTFLRTSEGLISWFGTSTTVDPQCNLAKGGSFSAVSRLFSSREASYLHRVKSDKHPEGGTTWREGNLICAEGSRMPRLCMEIPPGPVVSEITIDKVAGVRCIQGNCN